MDLKTEISFSITKSTSTGVDIEVFGAELEGSADFK